MNQSSTYEEVRQSNDELLEHLIEQYALDVKKIAFLYVHDAMEAEDILQEVFISCYQHLHQFKEASSYKTWLIRITINKCKDHHKRWSIRHLFYKETVELKEYAESAEQSLLAKEVAEKMMTQIACLTPKYKEILILYYYQELTMEEIAEVLSINMNTVKSRLLRAKAKLKEKVGGGSLDG